MRLVRLAFLCPLLLLVSVAVLAQDAPETKPDPAAKLQNLYRKTGRAWSHKITTWEREDGVDIATESGSVTAANESDATYSINGESVDGNSRWSTSSSVRFDSDSDRHFADAALPTEDVDTGFGIMRCKRHYAEADGRQITTWVSLEFHPLVVKQVELGVNFCRVKKLTSFASGETDPFLLYRMKGRRWLTKTTVDLGGGNTMVSYTRNEITAVTATSAKMKMWVLDKDQKPLGGMEEGSEVDVKFTTPEVPPGERPPVQLKQEKRKCTAGEFDCEFTDVGGTKCWSSSRWPGLLVYMESAKMTLELIEFDLGHDSLAPYRTAGNSWMIRNTVTLAGGMKVETYQRYEVTKVENGKATYLLVMLDANRRETFRNSNEMPLPEPALPRCAYSGQVEELIVTPAGALPCLVTETDQKVKMWMFHGIMARIEMKQEGFTSAMEVTELTLK